MSSGWQVGGIDVQPCPDLEYAVITDVSDPRAVEQAVATLVGALGGLDSVAHCAGVFRNLLIPVHMTSDDDWNRPLQVNLNGSFHIARACLPYLRNGGGSIVLTSSVAAHAPQPGGAAYSASKAGVLALARAIALEYARDKIRCNAVLPGYMRSAMTEKLLAREDLRADLESGIPLNRIAEPGEVAELIAFLMSDVSGYLTGEAVTIDGGAKLTAFVGRTDVDRMWRRYS